MSEKLKTLKEMQEEKQREFEKVLKLKLNNGEFPLLINDIRAEAVKIHNASIVDLMDYLDLEQISDREIKTLKIFIRKQNDLTEEDLK